LRAAERGPDGVAKSPFRPKAPSSGDGDEFVGTPAQFIADVVNDQIEVAAAADDARKALAQHRLGGSENDRFDPAHPFAPARSRGQVLEVEVEFAVGFSGANHRSKPVEPERRATGQFPDRAKGDKPPLADTARAAASPNTNRAYAADWRHYCHRRLRPRRGRPEAVLGRHH
jgi:hypothetical protein